MDPGTIIAIATTATTILSLLSKYVQDVKNAQEDVERLLKQIEDIHSLLLRIEKIAKSPDSAKLPALEKSFTAIKKTFSDIQEFVEKLKPKTSQRLMSKVGLRALKWPFTKEQMANYIARLESEKTSLSLAFQTDSTTVMIDIDKRITKITHHQDVAEQDRQLSKLASADGAAFNSYHRVNEPKCVPNTRVDLLHELQEWNENSEKHIFWLNGMAGMGKSTIARTVASEFSEARHLGASFFFSRGGGDLGNARKFVTTIAAQLARSFPFIKSHIGDAITRNENITSQGGLRDQWKELIVGPLSQLTSHQNLRISLVVDALDECANEQDVKIILQLFAEAKDLTAVNFKIFVTSRPETPVRLGFRDMPEIIHQDLSLQNISRSIVEKDITVYLKHELLTIRKERQLTSQWPGEEKIKHLVDKSDCIFIYVSTACLFLRDSNWPPDEQLSIILQDDIMEDGPTAKLDSMYTQVLKQSVFKQKEGRQRARLSARFKQIVGCIVVLFSVLPAQELAALLSVSPDEIALALSSLHSVLNIPKDVLHPIRLLHPSFRDFLLDEKRCADVDIKIEADEVHKNSTRNCLRLLSGKLKRNICGLKLPSTEVNDIQNAQIESCLSLALQYACHYWVAHLEKISRDRLVDTDLFQESGPVHNFFTKDFLHWLEAISLTRRVSEGVLMIIKLESLLELIKHDPSSALSRIVYDAKRFILSNRYIVEKAPLQVYASALIFCPRESIIRNQYDSEFPTWVKRRPLVEDNWSLTLQTLEGHTSAVNFVKISPDGQQLASASYDSTIRLWDTTTGASLQTLEGHTNSVTSVTFSPNGRQLTSASKDDTVRLWDATTGAILQTIEDIHYGISAAFSPDGQQLASGTSDGIVRLWDATTGASLQTLEGHTHIVRSVEFSPNGRQLASASKDNTVRLWDAKTGACLQTLNGHTNWVISVTFSPDGQQLASGSCDRTVWLWDVTTGATLQILKGYIYWVTSAIFSPNDQQLAAAWEDKTLRLCDAKTGAILQTLEGHTGAVASVSFSPDGRQLASASYDTTVRLWDAKTGASLQTPKGHTIFSPDSRQLNSASDDEIIQLRGVLNATQILEGHTSTVNSVTFSPDGRQLASASDDETVRLWDATSGASLQTLEGHTWYVLFVKFSLDGQQLASASYDNTIRLWDTTTGASLQTLEGHTNWINSVTFSPDGRQLASASADDTVRLWDATTGASLQTLEGHTHRVISVEFSPDGQQLASASHENTIQLWDAKSGACLHILEGHTDSVISAKFSPDGQQLASASHDNTVRLWDAKTGTCLQTLNEHTDWVNLVTFSPDGQQLASASNDLTVQLWDATTGASSQTLEGHTDFVLFVKFSPNGRQLASASEDTTVRLWDAKTGVCLQILNGHTDSVTSVTFSPDGQQLVSASHDGTDRLWDVTTGASLQTLKGHTHWVTSATFSPNGRQLASASEDKTLRLCDAKTGAILQTLEGHTGSVISVSFSPDGRQLASGSDDTTVRLWDAKTGASLQTLKGHTIFSPNSRQLNSASDDEIIQLRGVLKTTQILKGHNGTVNSVTFSPDGRQLASASDDCTIRLWDATTGASLQTLEGHTNCVNSVKFSPNGRQLASASDDDTWLWDATTGARLQLEEHTYSVMSVEFSPDGQQLASASHENTVLLWDAKTGECLHTLEGHTDYVNSVTFSSNGRQLASASNDHTIRVWNRNNGECLQTFDSLLDISHASFSLEELWIETPTGEIKLTDAGSDSVQKAPPFCKGWSINEDWLRWNTEKIMWFPAEFRRLPVAKHKNLFAIADGSHRLRFLELSSEFRYSA